MVTIYGLDFYDLTTECEKKGYQQNVPLTHTK